MAPRPHLHCGSRSYDEHIDFVTSAGRVLRARTSPTKSASPPKYSLTSLTRSPKPKRKVTRKLPKLNKSDDTISDNDSSSEEELPVTKKKSRVLVKKNSKNPRHALAKSVPAPPSKVAPPHVTHDDGGIASLKAQMKKLEDKLNGITFFFHSLVNAYVVVWLWMCRDCINVISIVI